MEEVEEEEEEEVECWWWPTGEGEEGGGETKIKTAFRGQPVKNYQVSVGVMVGSGLYL